MSPKRTANAQELAAVNSRCPDLINYLRGMADMVAEANSREDVRVQRHYLNDKRTRQSFWLMTMGVN